MTKGHYIMVAFHLVWVVRGGSDGDRGNDGSGGSGGDKGNDGFEYIVTDAWENRLINLNYRFLGEVLNHVRNKIIRYRERNGESSRCGNSRPVAGHTDMTTELVSLHNIMDYVLDNRHQIYTFNNYHPRVEVTLAEIFLGINYQNNWNADNGYGFRFLGALQDYYDSINIAMANVGTMDLNDDFLDSLGTTNQQHNDFNTNQLNGRQQVITILWGTTNKTYY